MMDALLLPAFYSAAILRKLCMHSMLTIRRNDLE